MIFCLAWNTTFTNYWKVLVLNFPEMGNTVFFEPKSWWKDDICWLGYWKVLALDFLEIKNTVLFESKSWSKDGIYWLLKSPFLGLGKLLFWTFRRWEIRSFFEPRGWWKGDIWSLWAFQDIPGPAKYDFSCSLCRN